MSVVDRAGNPARDIEVAPQEAGSNAPRWLDEDLLALMREHAPQGVDPEGMLPMLRGLVAEGTDPRTLVAAMGAAAPGSPQGTGAGATIGGIANMVTGRSAGGLSSRRPAGRKRMLRMSLIVCFWLLVWEIADRVIDNRLMLTGPIRTAQALVEQAASLDFWLISAASFGRISLGFACAFLAGIALALLAHRSTLLRDFLSPVMSLVKTVPMVSFIIMLLIWVGNQALTVWLAFLIVIPLVYTSMAAGLSAVDPRRLEMIQVYRISPVKRFLFIYRPAFMPFLISACQVGLGMSWKAGIMAEVFATPAMSIGKEMFTAKTFLDTPALFAWTVVVMMLSIVFERAVIALLRWASRPFGGLIGRR